MAYTAAIIAAHQLLMAAQSNLEDSQERLDCTGAATDIVLMLEAYAHIWRTDDR